MYPHCGCSTKNKACSTLFSSAFTNRTTLFLFVIIDFLSWQRFFIDASTMVFDSGFWQRFFFYFTHCFGFSFLFIFNLIFVSFGFLFLALLQFSFLRQISTDLSIEKVWHQGLHYKLRQNGVSGKLLNTLTDFLEGSIFLMGYGCSWSFPRFIYVLLPKGNIFHKKIFSLSFNSLIVQSTHE